MLVSISDCKKSISRSRGCRGSCTNFSRNKYKQINTRTDSIPKPVPKKPETKLLQPKATAPKLEPTIKKQEATKVQSAPTPVKNEEVNKRQVQQTQNAPNNPDPSRIGWNTGNSQQPTANAPPYPGNQANLGHQQPAPPPYTPHGQQSAYPAHQQPPTGYGQAPHGYGQAPPASGQAPPAYGQAAPAYGQAPPPYGQVPHGYGQPPPAYNGYGQPPPAYNGMQSYGQPPPYSGYGPPPPPGYNSQGGGLFGGNKYGSYGGYGAGLGALGYAGANGGYSMVKPRGFGSGFGKVLRNVAAGFLIWHVISGLTRKPYHVHNYYNNPEAVPQEITLPANVIMICEENVKSLCTENTTPLCTSNNTVLCVVVMPATANCEDTSRPCVTSTVSCAGNAENPECGGEEGKNITITLPCISNATLQGDIDKSLVNVTMNVKNGAVIDGTVFCVTTMAEPAPEEDLKVNDCLDGTQESTNTTLSSTNCTVPLDTNFTIPLNSDVLPLVNTTEITHLPTNTSVM